MTGDAAGEGELLEQPLHPSFVLRDVWVELAVGAYQVSVGHHGGAAVARAGDEDGVQVILLDDAVQVDVEEVQSGGGAPVAEQPGLHVVQLQGLLEERVVVEIDLADGQVVGRAPIGVHLCEQFGGERLVHAFFLWFFVFRRFAICHLPFQPLVLSGAAGLAESPSTRQTVLAIVTSSSVRITRTVTRLGRGEMTGALVSFFLASSRMPRNSRPSQIRARTGKAFSPIPPVKTSVSNPPRAAAKPPIHFFTWQQNSATASAARTS